MESGQSKKSLKAYWGIVGNRLFNIGVVFNKITINFYRLPCYFQYFIIIIGMVNEILLYDKTKGE